jgi:hypothetical protein
MQEWRSEDAIAYTRVASKWYNSRKFAICINVGVLQRATAATSVEGEGDSHIFIPDPQAGIMG